MILGAVLAWFTLSRIDWLIPYLLTFTAASFIYVAMSDLMPALNRKIGLKDTAIQITLITSAIGLNLLIHAVK